MLSVDELTTRARNVTEGKATAIVFSNDINTPVVIKNGRRDAGLLDPFTGEKLVGAPSANNFFRTVTALHRWLALEGASRDTAHAVISAANLAFLFIVVSGLYLWLPKIWKWRIIKNNLVFKGKYPNSKARDYNWHHVIGIWCLIPLFFVITTAVVFSYDWANKMVYSFYGEEVPQRGGPPRGPQAKKSTGAGQAIEGGLNMQSLLEQAKTYNNDWQSITLVLPQQSSETVAFTVDTGTGGQPQKRTDITLDRVNGEIVNESFFSDRTPGQQTRFVIRFLHTGEVLGFWGQTVAGLASLGACFLVYTGLLLSYRRLILPILARRKSAT
jgi:uncharacterized iron-regulated membrane protein